MKKKMAAPVKKNRFRPTIAKKKLAIAENSDIVYVIFSFAIFGFRYFRSESNKDNK